MPILLTVCNNSSMRNIIRRVKSVKLLNQLNGTRKIVPWKIALHPNPKPWKNLLGGGGIFRGQFYVEQFFGHPVNCTEILTIMGIGSHRGYELHRPASPPAINLAGTIEGPPPNLHRRL